MAFSFMNELFAAGGGDLEQTQFWVLMTLCWYANEADTKNGVGKCWPAIKTIAKTAHVSDNVARRAIKTLVEKKLITAAQNPGGKRIFFVHLDRIKALAVQQQKNAPLADVKGVSDLKGVADVKALPDVTGDPLQICKPSPCTCERGPLADVKAEPVSEPVIEPVSNQEVWSDAQNADAPPPPTDEEIAAMCAQSEPADLFNGAVEMVDLPKEKAPAKKPRAKKPSIARPDDVSEQTWNDFQTLRKTRRAPITQTVIDGFRKECAIAGIDLEEAMKICVRQGWQGFKADWCRRDNRSDYLPNSKFKRQECRKYKKGI